MMNRICFSVLLLMFHLISYSQYSDLWGVAYLGGANDAGFIFKMNQDASNYQVMYDMPGADQGHNPHTKLVEGPDGLLYGLAQGGEYDKGIIFTFDRTYNSYNIDYHLDKYIGGALTLAPNGKFYTLTSSYYGAICEYDPASNSLNIAYDYSIAEGKTAIAEGVLILVRDSLLYGTTYSGGANDAGVLFEYNINSGIYNVKHDFIYATGTNPGGYIVNDNGKIYGVTVKGGDFNKGTLFEYDIDLDTCYVRKHFETIHTSPGGICIAPDGNLYIHISIGGSEGGGGLCRFNPTTQQLDFVKEWVAESDAYLPTGSPMVTYNGKMFGTTRYGGNGMGFGTIYEYNFSSETTITRQGLNDGFPYNTVLIEVGERTVTSISIEAPATSIDTDNGTLQLSVSLLPIEADGQPVVWEVNNPAIASISSDGVLTASDNGIVSVKATANYGLGVADSISITITNQDGVPPVIPVESLTITSASTQITSFSNTLQMNADILPANATEQTVSWFVSDNSIATITSAGLLSPKSEGVVTVIVLANDGSGVYHTKEISITNYVNSITITPEIDAINDPFASIDFNAVVLPADASHPEVEWSVNFTSKASITQEGVFTAKANAIGYVTITCKALDGSGVQATHNVSIQNQETGIPVTDVSIWAHTYTIDVDKDTLQMQSLVTPENATVTALTWSTGNPAVAIVDSNGIVSPVGNGQTFVKAMAHNEVADVKNIYVFNQSAGPFPLEEIVFNPVTYYIDIKGGSIQLTPQLLPVNTTDSLVTINWYSDNIVSTVTDNGLVTASTDGTEEIVVTATNMKGDLIISNRAYVIISNQQDTIFVDSIAVISDKDTLDVDGAPLSMYASVFPVEAWNSDVNWSVNAPGIATISASGILSPVTAGNVTITATAKDGSGISGTKQIAIVDEPNIPVNLITLSSTSNTIDENMGQLQLTVTAYPENATNPSVSWSIDDSTLASITSNGLLSSIDNGTVTITVTANDGSGISASKEIVIINQGYMIYTESLLLQSPDETIDTLGGKLQLSAIILPFDATNKTVLWSVDDTTIASINSTGLLTAMDAGTVMVSATANDGSGISASKEITIYDNALVEIIFKKDTIVACDEYEWYESTYKSSGDYKKVFSYANVDSIAMLNLTINNSTSSTITEILSGSYTSPSGKVFRETDTYLDTIPNAAGCDSIITINLTITTSIVSHQSIDGLKVYPIPASTFVNISANTTIEKIEIFGILGNKYISEKVGKNSHTINVSYLKQGMYILLISDKNAMQTMNFMVE